LVYNVDRDSPFLDYDIIPNIPRVEKITELIIKQQGWIAATARICSIATIANCRATGGLYFDAGLAASGFTSASKNNG